MFLTGCNLLLEKSGIYQVDKIESITRVQTNVNPLIIKEYQDRLGDSIGWTKIPPRLEGAANEMTTGNNDYRIIYFAEEPEELYLVKYDQYNVEVKCLFNSQLNKNEWLCSDMHVDNSRVEHRYKTDILLVIVGIAKRNGVPDSVLFTKIRH